MKIGLNETRLYGERESGKRVHSSEDQKSGTVSWQRESERERCQQKGVMPLIKASL